MQRAYEQPTHTHDIDLRLHVRVHANEFPCETSAFFIRCKCEFVVN